MHATQYTHISFERRDEEGALKGREMDTVSKDHYQYQVYCSHVRGNQPQTLPGILCDHIMCDHVRSNHIMCDHARSNQICV